VIVLAIDPGSTESALVWYETRERRVLDKYLGDNHAAREQIAQSNVDHLAIEMAASFGSKVWDQVFTTVRWTGRFEEAWLRGEHGSVARKAEATITRITRREVKLVVAGSLSAKDGQIRNCLIDRWGGKDKACGTKKQPGPLFGITADLWQALAVAVTYADSVARRAA